MKSFWSVFYRRVVGIFFWGILCLLAITAAFSTSHILPDEITIFLRDSVWINLAAAAVVSGLFILGYRLKWLQRINEDEALFFRLRNTITLLIFCFAAAWCLSTQSSPKYDQQMIMLNGHAFCFGDWAQLQPGGYLAMYPNQLGLIWLDRLFSAVFGGSNVIAFQLLNALCLSLLWRGLSELGARFGLEKRTQLLVCFCGILFVPAVLYCSFYYGTLISLTLAVYALNWERRFMQENGKRWAFLSAGAIVLAVWTKNNSLIFLVALIIDTVMQLLIHHKARIALMLALLIVCVPMLSLPKLLTEQLSGITLDKGNSTYAWIAMGLSGPENDENDGTTDGAYHTEGWYNAFSQMTYGDPVQQDMLAKEVIANRVTGFIQDPLSALRFFTRKNASQWNNPDFQAWWIIQNESGRTVMTTWPSALLSPSVHAVILKFLNLLQFVVLAGALLWHLLGTREERTLSLLPSMVVVGGFLFHLIWQAKGQYTLPYFLLLFPMAAGGYHRLAVSLPIGPVPQATRDESIARRAIAAGVLVLLTAVYALTGWSAMLVGDEEAYQEYIVSNDISDSLKTADYTMQSYSDLCLDRDENGVFYLNDELDWDEGHVLHIVRSQGILLIKDSATGEYLTLGAPDEQGRYSLATSPLFTLALSWMPSDALGGYVSLRTTGNMALAFDDEGFVFVDPYMDDEYHIWYLNKMEEPEE